MILLYEKVQNRNVYTLLDGEHFINPSHTNLTIFNLSLKTISLNITLTLSIIMPTYQISLDQKLDQIATAAASENGQTVQKYLDKVVKEHLNRIENQTPFEKVIGK